MNTRKLISAVIALAVIVALAVVLIKLLSGAFSLLSGAVNAVHLSRRQAVALLAAAAILIPFFAWLLGRPFIGDSQPWLDAVTTVVSILAMYMMVKAIAEQWYIWIVLDAVQVVKWTIATVRGEAHAALMLVMFAFFLANAIYGLIQWNRLARQASDPRQP